jgi:hypothetical protein
MSVVYLVVTALIGLGIGVWFGMPGRYSQTSEDIEDIMRTGAGKRGRRKRIFTPLAWVRRGVSAKDTPSRGRRQGRGRAGFSLESPDDRE